MDFHHLRANRHAKGMYQGTLSGVLRKPFSVWGPKFFMQVYILQEDRLGPSTSDRRCSYVCVVHCFLSG